MIHNEARAAPRSLVHRFRESPQRRSSRQSLWRVPGAFAIGAARFAPPNVYKLCNGDWSCGGHYGIHMGVAEEQPRLRLPGRPRGYRRCAEHRDAPYTCLPGEVRSFVGRILGPADIVRDTLQEGRNRVCYSLASSFHSLIKSRAVRRSVWRDARDEWRSSRWLLDSWKFGAA